MSNWILFRTIGPYQCQTVSRSGPLVSTSVKLFELRPEPLVRIIISVKIRVISVPNWMLIRTIKQDHISVKLIVSRSGLFVSTSVKLFGSRPEPLVCISIKLFRSRLGHLFCISVQLFKSRIGPLVRISVKLFGSRSGPLVHISAKLFGLDQGHWSVS